MWVIVANLFGVISSIFFCASQFKTKKRDKIKMHLVCNVSDVIQYQLLSSVSGMVSGCASFISNCIYVFIKRRTLRLILGTLCGIGELVIILVVHENASMVIYVILKVASFAAKYFGKAKYLSYVELATSVTWMLYDYDVKAYIASAFGIFSVIFIIVGLVKYRGKLEGYD